VPEVAGKTLGSTDGRRSPRRLPDTRADQVGNVLVISAKKTGTLPMGSRMTRGGDEHLGEELHITGRLGPLVQAGGSGGSREAPHLTGRLG
jgi:hypothetical protein